MGNFIYIIIILIIFASIAHSVQNILSLQEKQSLLTHAETRIMQLEKEKKLLESQLQYVQSDDFVENEARNKLFMVKPGEQTVIIAPELLTHESSQTPPSLPIWKQWLRLFALI